MRTAAFIAKGKSIVSNQRVLGSRRRCFLYAKLQLHDWTHIVRCLDGSVKG